MKLARDSRYLPWFVLAASLVVCFGGWRWAETILLPSNTQAAQIKGIPIGNNSDLYPRWLGTREVLMHHRDPYSAEVTREIETGFYGRPLDPLNPHEQLFKESFVYPLYVVFLMAPTAALPFGMAQAVFKTLLLFALALSVPLWIYAVGLRPRVVTVISGMVLVVSGVPAVMEFHMQNLAALVIFFLAAAATTMVRDWFALGGFPLALATIKPDISGLMIVWFLLWALVTGLSASDSFGVFWEPWRFCLLLRRSSLRTGSGGFWALSLNIPSLAAILLFSSFSSHHFSLN